MANSGAIISAELESALDAQSPATKLRLILGDQLNAEHSWFQDVQIDVVYLIAELPSEARYVQHHIQKLVSFFSAMESFKDCLVARGHRVIYLTLDETQGLSLPECVDFTLAALGCHSFEYQRPDEYRLLQMLRTMVHPECEVTEYDSEHFCLPFDDIPKQAKPNKSVRMEAFYRRMRKRFDVLMSHGEPEGGQWNFDQDNRASYNADAIANIPSPRLYDRNDQEILARIEKHKVPVFGELHSYRLWPINQDEAITLLHDFCLSSLKNFGRYQDAMSQNSESAWLGYHSRLSFALNVKLLNPLSVINTVIEYYRNHDDVSLAQVEGFVRQILGWREFVRVMYWTNMPDYEHQNFLNADKALPKWFWTGQTHMQCMNQVITQSLDYAYAHHIQRLMVVGNFSLLTGLNPNEVDEWYLGIYVDAIQWVELPNTRGMALFSDGGWLASKPYAASGQYISRMSDYCKTCRYKVKVKTGEDACPFNSLYWRFLVKHQSKLSQNGRMQLAYRNWARYSEDEKKALIDHAESLLNNLDAL